jgi:hypothetical protein
MEKIDFKTLRSYTYNLERLRKIERSLHSLAEATCKTQKHEAIEKKLLAEAQEIADTYGLIAYHQGDPRGCCLFFVTKGVQTTKQYNDDGIALW